VDHCYLGQCSSVTFLPVIFNRPKKCDRHHIRQFSLVRRWGWRLLDQPPSLPYCPAFPLQTGLFSAQVCDAAEHPGDLMEVSEAPPSSACWSALLPSAIAELRPVASAFKKPNADAWSLSRRVSQHDEDCCSRCIDLRTNCPCTSCPN
jgi:hypothetical protein